jgi:hypothetical protein
MRGRGWVAGTAADLAEHPLAWHRLYPPRLLATATNPWNPRPWSPPAAVFAVTHEFTVIIDQRNIVSRRL